MTLTGTTAATASSRIEGLAVALDTSDYSIFEGWCRDLGPEVQALKVGLEAYLSWGPKAVECALETAKEVFLDVKLHDIPNTVAGAVRAVRRLGVHYVTVHAGGGPAMLEAAADAAQGEVTLLAVTLLTHLDDEQLSALEIRGNQVERVVQWAELAASSGVGGVVCSPLEVAAVRARLPRAVLVTPGVRLDPSVAEDDQRRVATPEQARAAGADLVVMGRPITQAASSHTVLAELRRRLSGS